MTYQFNNKTAIITGGSSGIGLATAQLLANKGANLILIARREELLKRAKQSLIPYLKQPDQKIKTICADVGNAEQINNTMQAMIEEHGVPDLLINCAGVAQPGYFENLDLDVFESMMNINYLGTIYTTNAVLPGMLQRGSGVIVNVASMAAFISLPGYTAYGASKFAVRGFSEALRTEVKRKGIQVVLVYPPDTDTPQHQDELADRPSEVNVLSGDKALAPEVVAEAILAGIEKKKFMVIPGAMNWLLYWLQTLTGPLSYSIIDLALYWALHQSTRQNSNRNSSKGNA